MVKWLRLSKLKLNGGDADWAGLYFAGIRPTSFVRNGLGICRVGQELLSAC